MNYPTTDEIIKIHEGVLLKIGGSSGLRDAGALALCAERPHAAFGGNEMYPTLFLKAAAAMETIARNHPFVDGNGRVSRLIMNFLLQKKEYPWINIYRKRREKYLKAVRKANDEDYFLIIHSLIETLKENLKDFGFY